MESESFESLLLPEDLQEKRPITCLKCHQEVGVISFFGKGQQTGNGHRLVSLSVNPQLVQGVVGSRSLVRFECDCGSTSIYHLLL